MSRKKLSVLFLVGFSLLFLAGLGFFAYSKCKRSDKTSIVLKTKVGKIYGKRASNMVSRSAKKIEIRELYVPEGYKFFVKSLILKGNEKTWKDVYNSINKSYKSAEVIINRYWRLNPRLRKAVFILGAITNMWRIGQPGKVGCSVETFHKRTSRSRVIPVKAYVDSPFADCNDFATMLYMMLKLAGFETRHVGARDHIYVEVQVDGHLYVMDAFYGFFTKMSNKEFLNQGYKKVIYYLLPYGGQNKGSGIFRPKGGSMRVAYLLTRGRLEIRDEHDYRHWDEFDIWMTLNGTEIDGNLNGLVVNGKKILIRDGKKVFIPVNETPH